MGVYVWWRKAHRMLEEGKYFRGHSAEMPWVASGALPAKPNARMANKKIAIDLPKRPPKAGTIKTRNKAFKNVRRALEIGSEAGLWRLALAQEVAHRAVGR
ncbi:hypothetical protein TRVL_10074 [Trypanosoma vivax]|nr:hypothetical protein TRVL_10074 [Trypanosoma vivax]